jgi:hypothetical protein
MRQVDFKVNQQIFQCPVVGSFVSTTSSYHFYLKLTKIIKKTGEIGLNVNVDKTSMVLFTKRRNLEGFLAPKLVDTEHGADTEQSGKISGSHFR